MTEKGSPKAAGVPSTEEQNESQSPDAKAQRCVSDVDNVVTNSIQKEPADAVEVSVPKKEEVKSDLENDDKERQNVSKDTQRSDVPEQRDKIAEPLTSYESLEERLKEKKSEEDCSQARRNEKLSRSQTGHANDENTDSLVPSQIVVTSNSDLGPSKALGREKTGRLRRGKWTAEEEAYVARVIQDFNSGYLDAPAGTTLRTYLSEKLQCDPMRITKKFTGDACIGKRVFHPAVRSPSNASSIDKAQVRVFTFSYFSLVCQIVNPSSLPRRLNS